MISKKDIIALAEHVTKRGKGFHDPEPMLPVREWMTGLLVLATLFLSGSLYAGFVFYTQLDALDGSVQVDTSVVKYKQELVKDVLETYRHRNVQFEALREAQGVTEVIFDLSTTTASSTDAAPQPVAP